MRLELLLLVRIVLPELLLERLGALVERVAVAVVLVLRVEAGVVLRVTVVLVPAARDAVAALVERVDVPLVRVASERLAAVCVLP